MVSNEGNQLRYGSEILGLLSGGAIRNVSAKGLASRTFDADLRSVLSIYCLPNSFIEHRKTIVSKVGLSSHGSTMFPIIRHVDIDVDYHGHACALLNPLILRSIQLLCTEV